MQTATRERSFLLNTLEQRLETPMLVLSFIWLILMILEFTRGLSPFFERLSNFIWILFLIDFAVKITLAPQKWEFLKRNWVTALALLLPALRLFRIARVARIVRTTSAFRGIRLARVLTSVNRGIRALGRTFGRRGFGYVMLLSIIITLAGAAGIYAFEKETGSIEDYGTAVWWTAMMLTTMGSDFFPKTAEGRILCLLLAIYGFAVFGYVTATVATFFVTEDSKTIQENKALSEPSLSEISSQLRRLESELQIIQSKIETKT